MARSKDREWRTWQTANPGVPVTFDKIQKSFGAVRVLEELNLEIEPGEFLVLLGASGSGKTTALRILSGLETATDGPRADRRPRCDLRSCRSTATSPWSSSPMRSIRTRPWPRTSAFRSRCARCPWPSREAAVRDAAAQVQLGELLHRYPRELSGGQRQRVALARAIIRRPSVFLMDEPLSNLDAKLRGHMRAELKHMQQTLGITTIYVTHDQIEAMTLAHRVAILERGVLQQLATPAEIYNNPANLFVAQFIGSPPMNVVKGSLEGKNFMAGRRQDCNARGRQDRSRRARASGRRIAPSWRRPRARSRARSIPLS